MSASEFPWLASGARRGANHPSRVNRGAPSAAIARGELEERAALYARLGYSARRALERLKANLDWDLGDGVARPGGLGDRELGEIVKSAYQRKSTR